MVQGRWNSMKAATPIVIAIGLATTGAATPATLEQMRSHRRVLVIAAPRPDDARLDRQRHMLADWKQGADDRNVSVVQLIGDRVYGSADSGKAIRRSWHVPLSAFTVILIGKDGHEALRSSEPLSGDALSSRIDAMPMRRAGGR
jgi:hypothetical protein